MSATYTPKQLNDLGDKYFYGRETQKNIEMAFTYYKKAADLNNPVGYYNVGKYFIEKEQHKSAIEYLEKSKTLGYTKAAITLSNLHINGLGVRKNKKKAFKMMQTAVEGNDQMALHQFGIFHLEGIGCKKDEKNAEKYFQLSADNKIPAGMYRLGLLYLESKQIKRDYENAFFWLDKAAENGDLDAIHKLISLYRDSHIHLKKKSVLFLQEMQFYYTELLARKQDIDALIKVASAYYEGRDYLKINYEKANNYYQALYNLDHTKGYLGLGLSYLYGRGVDVNHAKARELLEVAATRSDALALNAMGEIHRLGYGVEINHQRAKDFYTEAAKANETNALINLGLLNYRNQIQGAKGELAFQYMNTASEKGNILAHYWLGIFYEKGVGVPKDTKKAEAEYKKAIDADNEGAKYKYAQMLYENIKTSKMSAKKRNVVYTDIRDLLIEYINSPNTSDVNTIYSMYMLGEVYSRKDFLLRSDKISRYYYESAAEKKFTKAMVRMYFILWDKEPKVAHEYLMEAIKRPSDGESLFVMGNRYYEGDQFIEKDQFKAREFFGQAASLGYQPAKERLTMQ